MKNDLNLPILKEENQKHFFMVKKPFQKPDGTYLNQWWAYVLNPINDSYVPLSCSNIVCPIDAFDSKLKYDIEHFLKKSIGKFTPSYVLF